MRPQRFVSLWDMVANVSVSALIRLMEEIGLQVIVASRNKRYFAKVGNYDLGQDPKEAHAISQCVDGIRHIDMLVKHLQKLMPSPHIERARSSMAYLIEKDGNFQWDDAFSCACALRDTIQTECEQHLCYLYPKDDSYTLSRWKENWQDVICKFPETEKDIFCAVDLNCLDHATSSVYHCMRVLEVGLRLMCNHLGIAYSGRNWYNIINDIESKIASLRQSLPKVLREETLNYYSTVAKEFSYFKDGWRNYASHARCQYDKHQAASVLQHVRSFMSYLAAGFPDEPHAQGAD